MRILNPACHGHQSMALALLCRAANIDLHIVCPKQSGWETLWPATIHTTPPEDPFDLVIGYKPEDARPQTPFVLDIMMPSHLSIPTKYALTYSRHAQTPAKTFLNRRLPHTFHPPQPNRIGFVSLINGYKTAWPEDYNTFKQLTKVTWFGTGSPNGSVADTTALPKYKALVHIKAGGMLCHAVTAALALGVPVITNPQTYEDSFFHEVLFHNHNCLIDNDVQASINKLDADAGLLARLSRNAYEFADQHLRPDPGFAQAFKAFCQEVI